MRISEAAVKLDVPRHRIYYWQKVGLLPRDIESLSFEDLLKIRFVHFCRKRGISLQEIRRSIRQRNVTDWYSRLVPHDTGIMLSREQNRLLHPETGQMYLAYNEEAGAGPERQVLLFAEKAGEDGVAHPRLAALEERYPEVLSSGNFQQISAVLKEILQLRPRHVAALIEFGNLCFEHQKTTEALGYYERALEEQPDCVEAIYNVANIYFKEQKYAASIRYFHQCMELDPDFAEAYYNLGLLYFSLRYYEQALECLEGYLELDGDSVWSDQARQLIEDIQGLAAKEANFSLFEDRD